MRRPWSTVVFALIMTACASTGAFKAGEQAERRRDYDRAVLEYSRALRLSPDDPRSLEGLDRARTRASAAHAAAGRRYVARGLYEEAIEELRLALELYPGSETLAEELQQAARRLDERAPAPSIADIKERARERGLSGLDLGAAGAEPLGLSFRNSSLREVYTALGKTVGINFVFDPQFQDQRISLDLEDVPFDQVLSALGAVGRTFHRVTDSKIVTVVSDSPAKRREYEEQAVKTFFLSNADVKETIDLLRIVLGARRVAPLPGANAITINDSPAKIAAAERIVAIVDKERAEVLVEVEILEVKRSLLKEYGIEITSGVSGVDGVIGGIGPDPRQTFTLSDQPYSEENLVVLGLPGVVYRLLQSDSSTRVLASPQLRTTEGHSAQAHFGDQVPVPVTVFSPIAQGGLAQQPVTSFEYKQIGVNIDITPRVHHDGDVSLELLLDISSVGSQAGFGDLPTFNSRTVTTVLRLRDGETSVLAGLISETERTSLRGIPGLSDIPLLGRLFSRNTTDSLETDVIMTLTPHVLSRPALTVEDLRSFPLRGEKSPLLFEVPRAVTPSTPRRGTPAPRIQPVRPPATAPTPTPAPTPIPTPTPKPPG